MKILKKKKIISGIHPTYNCAKFQHDCAIFYFSRLPRSFDPKIAANKKTKEHERLFPLYTFYFRIKQCQKISDIKVDGLL